MDKWQNMDVVVDIGGAAVGGVKLRVGILDQILPREGPLKPWAGSGSPCACQCAVPLARAQSHTPQLITFWRHDNGEREGSSFQAIFVFCERSCDLN